MRRAGIEEEREIFFMTAVVAAITQCRRKFRVHQRIKREAKKVTALAPSTSC